MRLKNTSQYPADEVRRLVEFGMHGVRTTGLQVNVKNCGNGAYAGTAYERVPSMSSASGKRSVRWLIVLRIGPESSYPCDNLGTYPDGPWHPAPKPADLDPATLRFRIVRTNGVQRHEWQHMIRRPYGGKRAPVIVCCDWREGLVMLAAHEARHVYQFQHSKPRSEVDCERFAAKALERYRLTVSKL